MKVRTSVKADGLMYNRCETLATVRVPDEGSLKVKSGVRAGGLVWNRCDTFRACR
jgi:hypothetical protein